MGSKAAATDSALTDTAAAPADAPAPEPVAEPPVVDPQPLPEPAPVVADEGLDEQMPPVAEVPTSESVGPDVVACAAAAGGLINGDYNMRLALLWRLPVAVAAMQPGAAAADVQVLIANALNDTPISRDRYAAEALAANLPAMAAALLGS